MDKAAVFVLCRLKIKRPVKRLPSIFIPLACALDTSASDVARVLFCSPCVHACVLASVVVRSIEVNEVHPPLIRPKNERDLIKQRSDCMEHTHAPAQAGQWQKCLCRHYHYGPDRKPHTFPVGPPLHHNHVLKCSPRVCFSIPMSTAAPATDHKPGAAVRVARLSMATI